MPWRATKRTPTLSNHVLKTFAAEDAAEYAAVVEKSVGNGQPQTFEMGGARRVVMRGGQQHSPSRRPAVPPNSPTAALSSSLPGAMRPREGASSPKGAAVHPHPPNQLWRTSRPWPPGGELPTNNTHDESRALWTRPIRVDGPGVAAALATSQLVARLKQCMMTLPHPEQKAQSTSQLDEQA